MEHDNIVSGLDKTAKEVGNKFNKDNWNNIERKLSEFDIKVKDELIYMALKLFNITYSDKQDIVLKSFGEQFYNDVRKELIKYNLIDNNDNNPNIKTNKSTKVSKIKLKKIDQIRQENTLRIILEDLKRSEDNFDYTDFRYPQNLTSKIIEMRCIALLQCAKFIIVNKKLYLDINNNIKSKKISFIYNIIIGFQKLITNLENLDYQSLNNSAETITICSDFITDLKVILSKLKTIYNFDAQIAYKTSPQLLFFTDIDHAIPNNNFKPYQHQIDITTNLYNSLKTNTPLLVTLRTMTGTGKTTTVVALAKTIMQSRLIFPQHKNTILIFCCNLRSVMDQAAQWLFNADIPFAVGSIEVDKTIKIINNYNCKTNDNRVAIICSPDVCLDLIINCEENQQYVVFLDEPTIGLDVKSSTAKTNVKLMSILPRYAILSSATLPPKINNDSLTGYSWIYENHKVKHGEGTYLDIYSNKIHIGCEIKTFDGELVLPHLNRKTTSELKTTINNIKQLPFLGRAYTINVVKKMYELMNDEKLDNLPNIPQLFKDVDNLNTDTVRNYAMSLLEILSNSSDNLVCKICSTKVPMNSIKTVEIVKKVNDDDDDICWEDDTNIDKINNITYNVEFNKLGTEQAHRYTRQNLIATTKPYEFALKNFRNLIDDVIKDIQSLKKLNTVYYQELNIWQKEVNSLNKREFKNDLERTKYTEELNASKPVLRFPSQFQINTKEHIKHYAQNSLIAIDKNSIRSLLNPNDIPELSINDELLILLYCGVGIYTASLNSNYVNTVLKLAEEGKLAYLIADSSISYGTNYPINRVFIMDDISDVHSNNTIFQLMSRAGRVGKSWIAEAYVNNNCAERIINCSYSVNDNVETNNINDLYTDIVKENIDRDNKLINEVLKKETAKLAEEARLAKLAEEARLAKLAEEARLAKLTEEARLNKLAEEARLNKLAEEARLNKLAEQAKQTRDDKVLINKQSVQHDFKRTTYVSNTKQTSQTSQTSQSSQSSQSFNQSSSFNRTHHKQLNNHNNYSNQNNHSNYNDRQFTDMTKPSEKATSKNLLFKRETTGKVNRRNMNESNLTNT